MKKVTATGTASNSGAVSSSIKTYKALRDAKKYKYNASLQQISAFSNGDYIPKDNTIEGTPVSLPISSGPSPYPLVRIANNTYLKKSDLTLISGFDGEYENFNGSISIESTGSKNVIEWKSLFIGVAAGVLISWAVRKYKII